MASRRELLALWAAATFNCEQCGRLVTRADKPGVIYSAFLKLRYCSTQCAHIGSRHDSLMKFAANLQFEDKENGCWDWTGGINSKGYGIIHKDGERQYAHRFSYELYYGPCGLQHVLHSCDNPKCVRPDHLRLGSHQDNMADAKARNRFRHRRGSAHHMAKLTEHDVAEIRSSPDSGVSLAAKFGVARTTIYAVRRKQNWRHIDGASS